LVEFTSPIEFPDMPLSYSQRITVSFWVNIAGYIAVSKDEDVFHIVVPDMLIISITVQNNSSDPLFTATCVPFQFYDQNLFLIENTTKWSDLKTAIGKFAYDVRNEDDNNVDTINSYASISKTDSLWIFVKCAIALDSNDYYLKIGANRSYPYSTDEYARWKKSGGNTDSQNPNNDDKSKSLKIDEFPKSDSTSFFTQPFKMNNEILYFKNGNSGNGFDDAVRTDVHFRKFYRNTETGTLKIKNKGYTSGSDSYVFFYLKNLYVINEFINKDAEFQY